MFDSIFLNVGFLVILLWGMSAITKESKLFNKRLAIIGGALVIINIFVTYQYIQVQSSHNTATYNLYLLTSSSMDQVTQIANKETENMEDIASLNKVIEDIYQHTNPLLLQMNHTRLVSSSSQRQLYGIIGDLSEQLEVFLNHHNSILAKGEVIETELFQQYDQLKSELFIFSHKFRSRGASSGVRLGIIQHRLFLDENEINRMEKTVGNISKIIEELTSEN
ncbi:hypothetical protein Amet_1808 [Alkaliphilus metalliredigens QYMF]|uniref:Uncharacterized protein n=1 Tax=Alkaliphilus metalliredigens (strain QYMF) TaxID=293826 RepID=A6TP60_ALKMQ|nr:hypothetical protein [Alkaliphilus metalliredigens]ABR47978.1 hypothetical protein Amet_1808 [Alkaliphilus metalliredigens QYMF]